MLKKAIIIFSIFITNILFAQTNNDLEGTIIIETKMMDFGKVQAQSEMFYRITKIPKEFITSSLYVIEQGKLKSTSIPINDEYFNYDYFRDNYFPLEEGKIIRLRVKKFMIDDEEYYVAYKVL